jgi:hypothetical protein
MRTVFEHLLALLERVSILANTLQHLLKGISTENVSRMTLHHIEWDDLWVHTGILHGRRGSQGFPLAFFPSHSRENPSCLSLFQNKMFRMQTDKLTVVRVICGNGAIPARIRRSVDRQGAMAVELACPRTRLTSLTRPRTSCPCRQVDKGVCFRVRYLAVTWLVDHNEVYDP